MPHNKLNVATISASHPFLDTLAQSLLDKYKNQRDELSDVLILLPTRRTCRALQDSFLKLSNGNILILPRMQPIGDINAEELSLSLPDDMVLSLNPPIPSIKRQILLSKLIRATKPEHAHGIESDLKLAKALAQLMDEIHTENLDFSLMPKLVEKADIAEHWQITLGFLELLSEHWPKILNDYGYSDAAAYRNKLINTLNDLWQKQPPTHPIIMAGSTGSIPATGELAKTIASLPNGQLILPGLDKILSENAWQEIEEGHPQATLKHLLHKMEINRNEVKNFKTKINDETIREKLISNVMLPASETNQWGDNNETKNISDIKNDLKNIHRYNCDTIQDEADIIALILRETLKTKEKTAALITTNRQLARRVIQRCKKWNIMLDDTAGKALTDTPLGQYLLFGAQIGVKNLDSVALLSFLKHDFTAIKSIENFRHKTRNLEIEILRGKPIKGDFKGLEERYNLKINDPMSHNNPSKETLEFIHELRKNISPFLAIFQKPQASFKKFLETHIELAEKFYSEEQEIWSGDEGEAAAQLFAELNEYGDMFDEITSTEYLDIITQFMGNITIRPKFGMHPRLQILGQIEGRLVQTDRVILADMNEGSWPPDPGHDPWMSRPMRNRFGLPAPERAITLAAHDYAQAFCAQEVFLTRSVKANGAPTVPARWLERLDTYLKAIDINPQILRKNEFTSHLTYLDKSDRTIEIQRPAPKPPLSSRPKKLSVTSIEKWMKDPYSIYAQKILKLNKLAPLNEKSSAADRGTIFHEILHRFNEAHPKNLNNIDEQDFIDIALNVLDENLHITEDLSFWRPRLLAFAKQYLQFEKLWRDDYTPVHGEIQGHIDFSQVEDINFTLSARVDRIDHHKDGSYAIIDYKSGGQFAISKIISGETPQLPLEGLILSEGTFDKIPSNQNEISYLGYWTIDNASQSIKTTSINDNQKIESAIADTRYGLLSLIKTYHDENIAYTAIPDLNNAPRFNDYEHLERVKEWAVLGDDSSSEGGY